MKEETGGSKERCIFKKLHTFPSLKMHQDLTCTTIGSTNRRGGGGSSGGGGSTSDPPQALLCDLLLLNCRVE
jgi:hypothetical protein